MKKHLHLLSLCVISFGLLHGSHHNSLSATTSKPANTSSQTTTPPAPGQLNPYRADEATNDAYSIALSYAGGFFGPLDTIIAQGGVNQTRSATPNPQSYVQANLPWSNGFRLGAYWSHDAFNGPLLALDYLCVFGAQQTGDAVTNGTVATATANLTYQTARPISYTDGDTGAIYFAQALYNLDTVQFVTLSASRALLQTETTSLLLLPGMSFLYISHNFLANFRQQGSAGLIGQNMDESRFSGGVSASAILTKLITKGFGFTGRLSTFGHIAVHNLTSTETNADPNTGLTYGWNTNGDKPSMTQGFEVDLGLYYTFQFANKTDLAIFGSLDIGAMPSSTFVTSPGTGPNALSIAPLVWTLVDLGLAYRF